VAHLAHTWLRPYDEGWTDQARRQTVPIREQSSLLTRNVPPSTWTTTWFRAGINYKFIDCLLICGPGPVSARY